GSCAARRAATRASRCSGRGPGTCAARAPRSPRRGGSVPGTSPTGCARSGSRSTRRVDADRAHAPPPRGRRHGSRPPADGRGARRARARGARPGRTSYAPAAGRTGRTSRAWRRRASGAAAAGPTTARSSGSRGGCTGPAATGACSPSRAACATKSWPTTASRPSGWRSSTTASTSSASTRRGAPRSGRRAALGVPPDARLCAAIGSGFRRKGFDLLLDLWRTAPPPATMLVLVGDDERLASWRRAVRRPPLAGRVLVSGPRDDVEAVLAAADVVCVPSRQEAFGNVVLEACAAGVPVVTSRRAGAAELLDGPLAALVVD